MRLVSPSPGREYPNNNANIYVAVVKVPSALIIDYYPAISKVNIINDIIPVTSLLVGEVDVPDSVSPDETRCGAARQTSQRQHDNLRRGTTILWIILTMGMQIYVLLMYYDIDFFV